MFSCNKTKGSIFCDQTFWLVVVAAIVFLWVHYGCSLSIPCGCGEVEGSSEYCC